jgi:hypothetical protein
VRSRRERPRLPSHRGQDADLLSSIARPFDDGWHSNRDEAIVYDSDVLKWNSYEGGPFQQAASGLAYVPTNTAYNGNFETYGLEYWGTDDDQSEGYITWHVGGQPTWQLRPSVVGPNAATGIGQRISASATGRENDLPSLRISSAADDALPSLSPVPREPMTIILNFGMSDGFQKVDFFNLVWPAEMVRPLLSVLRSHADSIGR